MLSKDLMRQLRSFHRQSFGGLARDYIRQDKEGNWICPSSDRVLKKMGVQTIEELINCYRDDAAEAL